MRSVLAPKSELRVSADGRPSLGSPARPRLRLSACCPPPSPPSWRRAPFARSWHCASAARRRRRCAGAALSTPTAAFSRLLPPAVAPALAPRCLRPRLPLRAWYASPLPPSLTPRSPRPRVLRCREPGFSDAANQAGRMGEAEARVSGDKLVLDSATREALCWWRGASTSRRRRTTACGSSLAACRRRRLTVCTDKGTSIGNQIPEEG